MMEPVIRVEDDGACAETGRVVPDTRKIIWHVGLILVSIVLAPLYFSWSALVVFFVLSYITLLLGHSVGMHRMMIHRTFTCPKPIERALIYVGVLVGMGGPFGIIKTHDVRDWAQRQTKCHPFFSHTRGYLRDVTWQLFYRFEFENPPHINIEERLTKDGWLNFFERTWIVQNIVLALILFYFGGLGWVVWGVCARIVISIIGHWSITYFCHNPGPGKWEVKTAGVQASNLPLLGFLTHGECWHNNHHAFPESAKIGLDKGQLDPAWGVIVILRRLGLAKDIGVPRPISECDDLEERIT